MTAITTYLETVSERAVIEEKQSDCVISPFYGFYTDGRSKDTELVTFVFESELCVCVCPIDDFDLVCNESEGIRRALKDLSGYSGGIWRQMSAGALWDASEHFRVTHPLEVLLSV